jgi:hypothetical protein
VPPITVVECVVVSKRMIVVSPSKENNHRAFIVKKPPPPHQMSPYNCAAALNSIARGVMASISVRSDFL